MGNEFREGSDQQPDKTPDVDRKLRESGYPSDKQQTSAELDRRIAQIRANIEHLGTALAPLWTSIAGRAATLRDVDDRGPGGLGNYQDIVASCHNSRFDKDRLGTEAQRQNLDRLV